MSLLALLFQVVCILCGLIVFYIYAGFPILLWLITRRRTLAPPAPLPDTELPTVSMLVAAHNEESVIAKKIENCGSLDYPPEKLGCVFVSDSTDGTNDILRQHAGPLIQVHILPKRLGKLSAMCTVMPECKGSIIVFSDANTYYRPDSLRKLVRFFQDPEVGVVTGDVRILPSEEKFGLGEGLYYKYERALQVLESRFWATVAVDGAMYALRREHFDPPRVNTVGDDFVIGMKVGLKGLRILYDPEAIADEPPTPSDQMEFNRKVRIVAYGIQAWLHREGTPSVRQWRLFWVYFSHKLLRWVAPVFLLLALASSFGAAILSGPFWLAVFAVQALFYSLAAIGWRFTGAQSFIFRVPYYFSVMNLAAVFGIIRGLRRKQASMWQITERIREAESSEADRLASQREAR